MGRLWNTRANLKEIYQSPVRGPSEILGACTAFARTTSGFLFSELQIRFVMNFLENFAFEGSLRSAAAAILIFRAVQPLGLYFVQERFLDHDL